MAGNSFGQLFRIMTFGESHGKAVGVVVDGCPAGLFLTEADIQQELDKRKPGQSKITTQRKEEDQIEIYSGVFEGKTLGTPIAMMVKNKDAKASDYLALKNLYRPSHADFTYEKKYGIRDFRGGGRASARETLARVAAGAIAKKYLKEKAGMTILAFTEQIGEIKAKVDLEKVTLKEIEQNMVRCPDQKKAKEMIALIEKLRKEGDSVGGIVRGVIRQTPIGLGEPVFDRLPADLGKAMLSINAVKGFDFGSGFEAAEMRGSEHNDEFFLDKKGRIRTKTNFAGGTLGGISNGELIYFRVAFKPTATISKKQQTVTKNKKEVEFEAVGRHDPCVVPRAIPIVEAMAALTLMDHYLRSVVGS